LWHKTENYEKRSWVTLPGYDLNKGMKQQKKKNRYFFETILAFLQSRLDIKKHEFKSQINRDWAMTFQTNQPLNISLVNLFVCLFLVALCIHILIR